MERQPKELSEQAQNYSVIKVDGQLVPVLGDPEAEKRRINRERVAAGRGLPYQLLWRKTKRFRE